MTDSITARTGLPSAAHPLFILAMDHRDSFGRTLFGVTGTPAAGRLAGVRDAKDLIFAGAAGADPRDGLPPAGMNQSLLAEVGALRAGQ
jgi:hypothetical protein